MSYTSRLSIDTAYHINNTDSVSNIQKVDQIKDLLSTALNLTTSQFLLNCLLSAHHSLLQRSTHSVVFTP